MNRYTSLIQCSALKKTFTRNFEGGRTSPDLHKLCLGEVRPHYLGEIRPFCLRGSFTSLTVTDMKEWDLLTVERNGGNYDVDLSRN